MKIFNTYFLKLGSKIVTPKEQYDKGLKSMEVVSTKTKLMV